MMARVVRVTPLDGEAKKGAPVDINLDHVLWMEERPQGTLLFLNSWGDRGASQAIINSTLLVAESEREILWSVCPLEAGRKE